MDENRERYTSERVVEVATGAELTLAWTPIVRGSFEVKDETGAIVKHDVKIIKVDGTVDYADADESGKVTGLEEGDRVAYKYDNVIIPQEKLPTMVGRMKGITLEAKARRIAVEYSQIAAYQA